jgi:N-acetylglucosamine-6-phosphate deacetylase
MMDAWLCNGRILVDGTLKAGLAIGIRGHNIERIAPEIDAKGGRIVDIQGNIVLPGFIDVQVNGGDGKLFNDDPSVETIRAIGAAHRKFGTTGYLPTLISDDFDKIEDAIEAVRAAINEDVPGVLGIHLEGPFLNPKRCGAHDKTKFRTMDDHAIELLTSLDVGRTLVTLAPETVEPSMISRLAAGGVIVSIGHSNATYGIARSALNAGATAFTHLFNAMSPLSTREPGVVGAALDDQSAWCGLIVDRIHVHKAVLQMALRCRPLSKFMLVTDAMPSVGSGEPTFLLNGNLITVGDDGCRAADGTIAGTNLDMASAVRNVITWLGRSIADAAQMASANPAALLAMSDRLGSLKPDSQADLVVLDDQYMVRSTWIRGVEYRADETAGVSDA